MGKATVYCIMHMEKRVAQVSTAGECKIYFENFMPMIWFWKNRMILMFESIMRLISIIGVHPG